MKIKGIIFDFNGTMIYDTSLHEVAWKTFLKSKINRKITDEEFKKYIHGRNTEEALCYFFNKTLTKNEIADLSEEKEVTYRQIFLDSKDKFKLVKGLPEFLNYLQRNNIPSTIATASGESNLKFFFENLKLDKWFDISKVVYDDGSILGKPEPLIYQKAAKMISIEPQNCMAFEDSALGIIAANRAKIGRIIKVSSALCKKGDYSLEGIYEIISDYNNAIEFLATTDK